MTYHRNWPGLAFLLALISSPAAAQSDAGPVFQRTPQAGRIIEHRVDLGSVHKTWAYKTFWTRAADARTHEPVMVRQSFWPRLLADPVGALTFRQVPWSRKFVIDCAGRRIGARVTCGARKMGRSISIISCAICRGLPGMKEWANSMTSRICTRIAALAVAKRCWERVISPYPSRTARNMFAPPRQRPRATP